MDILHPMIYKAITMIPYTPGVMLLVVFFGVFVVDFCITVSTILKFNRRLKMMDEIAAQIHKISDEIGENIYENVMEAMEVSENFQREHAEIIEKINASADETRERWNESTETAKARINESVEQTRERWNEKAGEARKNSEEKRQRREELRQEYMEMMKYHNAGFTRLLKAFPKMKSKDNNEMLEKFRENLKK